jgi:REP element-mobilizing transposase RayT
MLDAFVVMPDHIHGIVVIGGQGARQSALTETSRARAHRCAIRARSSAPQQPLPAGSRYREVRARSCAPQPPPPGSLYDAVRARSSAPQPPPPGSQYDAVRARSCAPQPPPAGSLYDAVRARSSAPQPPPPGSLYDAVRARSSAPQQPLPAGSRYGEVRARSCAPQQRTLGTFIRGYKADVTTRINTLRDTPGVRVWQRNYYEHIIRTDRAWAAIARYIADNPGKCKGAQLRAPTDPNPR